MDLPEAENFFTYWYRGNLIAPPMALVAACIAIELLGLVFVIFANFTRPIGRLICFWLAGLSWLAFWPVVSWNWRSYNLQGFAGPATDWHVMMNGRTIDWIVLFSSLILGGLFLTVGCFIRRSDPVDDDQYDDQGRLIVEERVVRVKKRPAPRPEANPPPKADAPKKRPAPKPPADEPPAEDNPFNFS